MYVVRRRTIPLSREMAYDSNSSILNSTFGDSLYALTVCLFSFFTPLLDEARASGFTYEDANMIES